MGEGERGGPQGGLRPRHPRQGTRRRRRGGRRAVRRCRRGHRHGLTPVRGRSVRRGHRGPRTGLRRSTRPQPVPGRDVLPLVPPARRDRPGAHHPRHPPGRGGDRMGGRPAGHPRDHDPDHVAGAHPLQRCVLRPGLGRLRRDRPAGPHPLRRGPHGGVRRAHRGLPGRGGVVGGPPGLAPAVRWRVRALPRPQVRRHRGRRLLGPGHDVEMGPVHGGRTHHQEAGRHAPGQDLQTAVGLLRHQHLHRCLHHVARGDPSPLRHRHRRRDVGHRLPAPRRDLAAHAGQAAVRLRLGAGGRHGGAARPDRGAGLRVRPGPTAAHRPAHRSVTGPPRPGRRPPQRVCRGSGRRRQSSRKR